MKATILIFFWASLLLGQGSGSVSPSAAPTGGALASGPFDVVRSVTAKLVEVLPNQEGVVIDSQGKNFEVRFDKKLRITANRGTEYSGRKNIQVAQLRPGMIVKVTLRTTDLVAIELRIIKDEKA